MSSVSSSDAELAQKLIALSVEARVLLFGSFTLKSGRISPYFFNAGLLYTGQQLFALAQAYAAAIASNTAFDDVQVIFGPAYKGISLAAITVAELQRAHGRSLEFAYDRKEAKDHGEGGTLVGAPLQGKRVLVLDDVITAGPAIRGACDKIEAAGGRLAGVVELLDRQERGTTEGAKTSAVQRKASYCAACNFVGLP